MDHMCQLVDTQIHLFAHMGKYRCQILNIEQCSLISSRGVLSQRRGDGTLCHQQKEKKPKVKLLTDHAILRLKEYEGSFSVEEHRGLP